MDCWSRRGVHKFLLWHCHCIFYIGTFLALRAQIWLNTCLQPPDGFHFPLDNPYNLMIRTQGVLRPLQGKDHIQWLVKDGLWGLLSDCEE